MSRPLASTLLLVFSITGCTNRGASFDGGSFDATVHRDLPAAQAVDILVVAPFSQSAGLARQALASIPWALLERLKAASQLDPASLRLGVVSTSIEGKSICDSPAPPAGELLEGPSGVRILTGENTASEWSEQVFSASSPECRNPNFLEAASLAIDGRNTTFPRHDAVLVVLLLANMDDCSVDDFSLWNDPAVWEEDLSWFARCYRPAEGFLYPVNRYLDSLLQAFPGRIFVAAVGSADKPTYITDPGGNLTLQTVCEFSFNLFPTPRIASFIDGIGALGDPRLKGALYEMGCEAATSVPNVDSLVDAIVEYAGF